MLARAAEENARTWRFAIHEQTTFTVTYRYKLVAGLKANPDNPVVLLRLPSEVEVSTLPMPPLLDPAPDKPSHNGGGPPTIDPKDGSVHLQIPVVVANKPKQ